MTAECFPIGQNNPKSGRKVERPYHSFPTISFSLRRFFRQHSLNAIYHLRVDLLPRGDHTKIRAERAPKTKVKRTPTVIGDDSASFFDEERPRRMVLWKERGSEAVSQVDYFWGAKGGIHKHTQIFSWYPLAPPPRPPPATGKRK